MVSKAADPLRDIYSHLIHQKIRKKKKGNNKNGYNFRGADFRIPRFHLVTHGKCSLRYLGPKLWTSLLSKLRNLPSLQSFKLQTCLVNHRGWGGGYSPIEMTWVLMIPFRGLNLWTGMA